MTFSCRLSGFLALRFVFEHVENQQLGFTVDTGLFDLLGVGLEFFTAYLSIKDMGDSSESPCELHVCPTSRR